MRAAQRCGRISSSWRPSNSLSPPRLCGSGLRHTRSHQVRSTPTPLRLCQNLQFERNARQELEAELTWLFSFVRVAHLNRPNGLDCADKKMSLQLQNGKNAQKSKVLTFE